MTVAPDEGAPDAHATALAEKARIRAGVLATREALSPAYRHAASARIVEAIIAMPAFRAAAAVMAYASFGSEVDTRAIVDSAIAAGKTLVMPRVNRMRNRLDMYCVRDPAIDLVAGVWGILEPDPARCAPTDGAAIDFIVVPGVAFDRTGGRIGYGKGYYDKLLGERLALGRPLSMVAGAFDVQIVERVPLDDHDVIVDTVVTESRRFECSR